MNSLISEVAADGTASTGDSVARCIAEIMRAWSRGTRSTLELARLMSTVRKQLPRGKWAALWKSGQMPFARRKGHMLVVIGEGLGWASVQTFAHLPPGWSILYHLARLKRRTLERLLQQAVIHPGLTLLEARRIVTEFTDHPIETKSSGARVAQRLKRFEEFVRATLLDWTAVERQRATEGLTQLLEQIRGADGVKRNGAVSDFAGGLLNHHRNTL